MNEKEIIKKCQDGEMENFTFLYDAYIDKIYRFIYYKTSHREIAEDLTSKTFFKAIKNIRSLKADELYFSAWIFTIARNTVVDYYRSKKSDIDINDLWDLGDESDILLDIDNKNKVIEVKKYLSSLKKKQREIMILRIWQEMPYKEIAEIMDESEANCKMIFSRTISKLRSELPLILLLLINFKIKL